MGITVLGIDPGSRATGYGILHERSGQLRLIDAGVIRPPAKAELAVRLGHIFSSICELIETHKPQEGAIEDVFCAKNASSALKLGQARGAVLVAFAANNIPVWNYEPTAVKKSIVGVGRAEKNQVAFMVGQILGCKPDWASDCSDALSIALCHLNQHRMRQLAAKS